MIATCLGKPGRVTIGGTLLAALVAVPATRAAAESPLQASTPPPRIRALDPEAARLLERGSALSPSFAQLVEVVEQSDLLVYVSTGMLEIPGHLRFAGATPCGRLVRITINALDQEVYRIAALGHELQHAVEIVMTPGITDTASLASFYERHGFKKPHGGYCTRAADRMTFIVKTEVCQARPVALNR